MGQGPTSVRYVTIAVGHCKYWGAPAMGPPRPPTEVIRPAALLLGDLRSPGYRAPEGGLLLGGKAPQAPIVKY